MQTFYYYYFLFINNVGELAQDLMHEKGVCARIEEEHRQEAPEA